MRVSEKTLELNIGAEMLPELRNIFTDKVYLRGLTQAEESVEGVDSFVHLDEKTKIIAFQFKRPSKAKDSIPYYFRIQKDQHDLLYQLAQNNPYSVFYVFPFYSYYDKFIQMLPNLLDDTRLLDIYEMKENDFFKIKKSRQVECDKKIAKINPEYPVFKLNDLESKSKMFKGGISVKEFLSWHNEIYNNLEHAGARRNPWLFRGLRLCVIQNI